MKTLSRALLVAALSGASAFGQSPEQSDAANVEELDAFVVSERFLFNDQVNALKTPTPIVDVPQSMSITTSDQIKEQGFDSIGDIVDYTPGVNNAQGEGHRDAVVFRGSRSTGSFFIDGVRDDIEHYRSLYNVEQLEILRGPNALLFGRGGTGGVINRVTKKGVFGENFTEHQLSVDTFGAYTAQIDGNLAIGENAAVRVNAFYDSLANHRDYFDGERFGVNPTLRYKLGEQTNLNLTYEYNDHERFIDRGIPTGANGRPIEALAGVYFGDPNTSDTQFEGHVVRAALNHRISDFFKTRFDLAYGDYDKAYDNFYASAYDPTTQLVTLSGYEDSTQRKSLILSGNLIGEFETGAIEHTVVSGFEFLGSDNNNDRMRFDSDPVTPGTQGETIAVSDLGTFRGRTFNQFGDRTEADLSVVSFYVQNEIALSDHFDVILGARYDRFDFEVDSFAQDGSLSSRRGQVDEEITPRLGLVFKPQENISLYTSYSKTFLPKSGEQFASISGGNLGLEPDEFINLEAGLKWDLNERVSLTTAIFELEKDGAEGDGFGNYDSVAIEVNGFEAQIQGEVTDTWSMTAGYSYLDGEVTGTANNGNRPRELPEHAFSIWNRYQLTEKLGLGLGAIYQGETYINENNVKELPGFVRVDAAAFYEITEDLRLQINIENLTDELYFPHAHGDHQATVGESINATVSLTARF